MHQEDMSAQMMVQDAMNHPGQWRRYDVSALDIPKIRNIIRTYYPFLEIRVSHARRTIELRYLVPASGYTVPVPRGWERPTACGCGYDDCPVCGRCYHCQRGDNLQQTKMWNGHRIEIMSQAHLWNTIEYIKRNHGDAAMVTPLVKQMKIVVQAKSMLGIDEDGSPSQSCIDPSKL